MHDVAQHEAPESRVVYVDNDPIVLAQANALLTSNPAGKTAYIQADLHGPERILSDPGFVATVDRGQPVGLILVGVLMFLLDERDPYGTVRRYIDPLALGSYVAITHLTPDFDPVAVAANVAASERAAIRLQSRRRDEVAAFFTGLELVEPGPCAARCGDRTWSVRASRQRARSRQRVGQRRDVEDAHLWVGVARQP